jgi:hypothetical protein
MARLVNYARFVLLYVFATFNPVISIIVLFNERTLGLLEGTGPTSQKLLISMLPVYAFVTFILICLVAVVSYSLSRGKYPNIKIHEFLDAFLFSQLAYLIFIVFLYRLIEGQEAVAWGLYFFLIYIPLALICIPLSHYMFNRMRRYMQEKKLSIGTDNKLLVDLLIFIVIISILAAGSVWRDLPYTKYFPPRHGSPQEALQQISYALKTRDAELFARYVDIDKVIKESFPDDPAMTQAILQDIQNGQFVVENDNGVSRIAYKDVVFFLDENTIHRRNSKIYIHVKFSALHKQNSREVQLERVDDHYKLSNVSELREIMLYDKRHSDDLVNKFNDFESVAPKSKDYLDFQFVSWLKDNNRSPQEVRAKVLITNKTAKDMTGIRFLALIREAGSDHAIWDFSMYSRIDPPLSPGQSREIICVASNIALPKLQGEFEYRFGPYQFYFTDNSVDDLRVKR